jgi:hypothetical protein
MLPAGDPTSDQRNFTMRRSVTSPELETTQPSAKQDKLKKFFGEDAAVAVEAASSKSAVNDTPSFLGYDYDPADIVVNMEGDVKGGTLSALTERLTSHQFLGKQWHYFCLPNQILIY